MTKSLQEGILCCLTRENQTLCDGAQVQGVMDTLYTEAQTFLFLGQATLGPYEMTGLGVCAFQCLQKQ